MVKKLVYRHPIRVTVLWGCRGDVPMTLTQIYYSGQVIGVRVVCYLKELIA